VLLNEPLSDRISLRRRVLKAGVWSIAGYGFGQAMRFGTNLLLTRLLMPEMFGVMAIAMVVMAGLNLFSDLGLNTNIVQSKRGNDPTFLNTAWVVQIVRGVLLWLIALGIAALLAFANHMGAMPKDSAYADPDLPSVIAVLSFTAVIAGFNSTKLFEANRNLVLGRVALVDLAAQIAGLSFMLGWILFDRSIWALVAGSLFGSLSTTVLNHWWVPGTPNRWQWDTLAFWQILHFGKWMFVAGIIGFFVANTDRLLLGGLIGPTMLGVYVIAYNLSNAGEQVLFRLIAGVSFPALSEVARERPADLKATYYRVHAVIAPAAYFCAGVLMMSGQSLVGVLYDPRYADAGWMLEILAVALLTIPFHISLNCFTALGMPRLYTSIYAVRLIAIFVTMPLGFYLFDLTGAVCGLVASSFLWLPAIIVYSVRYRLFDLRRELLALPVVGLGIGVGIAIEKMIALAAGH
jgi:O-antigen/teichoic acid export membrane protein